MSAGEGIFRRAMSGSSRFQLVVWIVAFAAAQGSNSSSWQTLTGDAPLVVARGGFSGLFPDSSSIAYQFAGTVSLADTPMWCDVQLTKDGAGICFPYLKLENSSDISNAFPEGQKEYLVNGVPIKGWFSVDFTFADLQGVVLTQGIYSRTDKFNGFPIQLVEDVAALKPPSLWLNIEHDTFFTEHNLSMRSYVLAISKQVVVKYISSPEVNFLISIVNRFSPKVTKLVFRFLNQDDVEPSTNKTYGSLLTNLTFIKTFASGIIVPKAYIWPVDNTLYLQPHTSVVLEAHKAGLEVFAAGFVNDDSFSYNYSYDPTAEYLSFIDNGEFSVDGVLSDFPITASAAIDCYSHVGKNDSRQVKPLVISHNGASGDFPSCTNLAYTKAITDGVDVIDCNVQVTKDMVPICLSSINLIESTNVAQTDFSNLTTSIPEIKGGEGIFTFNLTWDEIKTLKPEIVSPYATNFKLFRNPKYRDAGFFLSLSEFLALPKNTSSATGVLIRIENAAFLATQGISVADVVLDTLSKSGFDNQTSTKVMIQSTSSSVLEIFKSKNDYEIVYDIDENIRDALNSTLEDIKSFADSVVIRKTSIYTTSRAFIINTTNVVQRLQSFNLQVYVQLFRNEFVSQAWDFFADPSVEINTFVNLANIDGVVTDFPKTSVSYRKNRCLSMKETPAYMQPVEGGSLLTIITPQNLPPIGAPAPVLSDSDVNEPPLPSITSKVPPSGANGTIGGPTSSPSKSGQPKTSASVLLSTFVMLLVVIPMLLL